MNAQQPIVRRPPKPPLKPFVVTGVVLARRLPVRLLIDDRVLIYRSEPTSDRPSAVTSLQHPQIVQPHWSTIPAHTEIKSEWRIDFRVDAETSEAAFEKVERVRMPLMIGALQSINVDSEVSILLTRIAVEGTSGQYTEARSPWSASGQFRLESPVPADSVECDQVGSFYKLALDNGDARAACEKYATAHRLAELHSGLRPLQASALLGYMKAIELVSEKVVKSRGEQADEAELTRVVEGLATKLAGQAKMPTKITAIHEAATRLSVAQGRFLSLKIRAAGVALAIEDSTIDDALGLAKLRNTQLSHPGGSGGVDLDVHLEPANRAARAYLLAFVGTLK